MARFPESDLSETSLWIERAYGLAKFLLKFLKRLTDEQVASTGLSWTASRSTNLHIESRVLKRGKDILAYKQRIPLERDTILVFADEAPRYNWAHPCRYLLHDAKTGELYREVKAQFPPYMTADVPKTFEVFHQPVRVAMLCCFLALPITAIPTISNFSTERYVTSMGFLLRISTFSIMTAQ